MRIGSSNGAKTLHIDAEQDVDVVRPLADHFHMEPIGLKRNEMVVIRHSYCHAERVRTCHALRIGKVLLGRPDRRDSWKGSDEISRFAADLFFLSA